MDEIKNNAALEAEDQEESLILKFRRPYQFEGQEYTELDLSGLEDVTAGTLENIGKILAKKSPGLNPATIEMEMGYCELLAARVTGKPGIFPEASGPGCYRAEKQNCGFSLRRGWEQLTPAVIRKACVGMSIHLRTGLDYLLALSVDDLNDLADTMNELSEEVRRNGKK